MTVPPADFHARQSRAYREATEADHVPDEELPPETVTAPEFTVEDYELAKWDEGRDG
jgi:hypothetical protein